VGYLTLAEVSVGLCLSRVSWLMVGRLSVSLGVFTGLS
jgi:hypothetical protein